MATPTIGLVMIVRDESHILARAAASLAGQIDRWTIVDTGSSDDTVEVVGRVFDYAPGQVIEDRWRGFGPSRNVALAAAEPCTDWLLHLDADDVLGGRIERGLLDPELDVVEAEYRFANLRYWVPRLVRSGRGWRWEGRAHEFLTNGSDAPKRLQATGFWAEHRADGGNRGDKLAREEQLLRQDWDECPDTPRTAFYLGRTYDDLGSDGPAAEWYRRRLALGGWDEETFYARYRLGVCLLRAGADDEGCGALWRAWGERPHRAEPLVALARHYRTTGQWQLAWQAVQLGFAHTGAAPDGTPPPGPGDRLFVDVDATGWEIAYEASIAAWYVGEWAKGRRWCEHLLARHDLPAGIRASVAGNQAFYRTPDAGADGRSGAV